MYYYKKIVDKLKILWYINRGLYDKYHFILARGVLCWNLDKSFVIILLLTKEKWRVKLWQKEMKGLI